MGQQPIFDKYSLGHIAAGLAYRSAGLTVWQTLASHGIWEAMESPAKLEYPSLFPIAEIDTPRNIAGDLLAAVVGWHIWQNTLGEKRTGGGWLFLGVGIFAVTAWSLRWKEHPPWESASWKKAAQAYAGQVSAAGPPKGLPNVPRP
jgi:hypothetical protein